MLLHGGHFPNYPYQGSFLENCEKTLKKTEIV